MFMSCQRSRVTSHNSKVASPKKIDAPLLIMKSNGGVVGVGEVERVPAYTALSGPAAGVVGAGFVGAAAGCGDVIGSISAGHQRISA